MRLLHYGYFEYDSTGFTSIANKRRIIGSELKICKDSDLEFTTIYSIGDTNKINTPFKDDKYDIITMINELESDIERYKSLGTVKEFTIRNGREVMVETNFNSIAMNCEKIKERLYKLL